MEILVTIKPQYGCVAYHPDNAQAKTLAEIAGTKTLTPRVLKLVQELGFEVKGKFDMNVPTGSNSNYMPIELAF